MLLTQKIFQYIILVLITIIILVYFGKDYENDILWNLNLSYEKGHESDEPIKEMKILLWTPYYGSSNYEWSYFWKRITSHQCPESRCTFFRNKTLYMEADAIIFSLLFMGPQYNHQVPPTHPVDQLWVMLSLEAGNSVNLKDLQQIQTLSSLGFNWTMHFRQDSDVVIPYGAIKQIESANNTVVHNNTDFWSKKDKEKLAVWMVSHCGTRSRRETYCNILKKHIRVDVYGKCGTLECGVSQKIKSHDEWKMKECSDVISRYFFYLAWENSICRDYVTEKFFRSMMQEVVVVVMGGADYKRIAPPHSYIDALDFPNPKDLADYLKKVASDPVLYNKYFEWKPYYEVDLGLPYSPMTCDLCEKLHQHRRSKNHLIPTNLNLTKWLNDIDCLGDWQQAIAHKLTKDES